MSNQHTPHIKATSQDFAKTVLMPGDPLRSKFIAENFLENPKLINNVRGIQGYTGIYKGLPVSVMEAIASGLPVIASNIRGNKDLVDDSSGCLFNPSDSRDFCRAFNALEERRLSNNLMVTDKATEFDKKIINKQMYDLYQKVKEQ